MHLEDIPGTNSDRLVLDSPTDVVLAEEALAYLVGQDDGRMPLQQHFEYEGLVVNGGLEPGSTVDDPVSVVGALEALGSDDRIKQLGEAGQTAFQTSYAGVLRALHTAKTAATEASRLRALLDMRAVGIDVGSADPSAAADATSTAEPRDNRPWETDVPPEPDDLFYAQWFTNAPE